MKKKDVKSLRISGDILFELAAVTNRLLHACREECNIEPQALLVLLYARQFGKPYRDETYIQRHRLTKMLKEKFSYTDTDISKLMSGLHSAGLILRSSISLQERDGLFKSGGTQVIILNATGNQKIEEFRNVITRHAENSLQSPLAKSLTRTTLPLLTKLAKEMLKRYEPT